MKTKKSPLRFTSYRIFICATSIFWIAVNNPVNAQTLLWLGYAQNQSDYFGDGRSQLEPAGGSFGISYEISEQWQMSLSYAEFEGDGNWPVVGMGMDFSQVNNSARSESNLGALSFSWVQPDYSLSLAYSQAENSDRALLRFPLSVEGVEGEDKVLSLSWDNFAEHKEILLNWSLGVQYSDSENRSLQVFFTDPATTAATAFDQTSWSSFLELSASHWVEQQLFSWAPQLTLSWNWELDSSGDPVIVVNRGDQRHIFTQFNDRIDGGFRAPDSGFWELAFNFDFHNDWSAQIAYSKSLSVDSQIEGFSFDISVLF